MKHLIAFILLLATVTAFNFRKAQFNAAKIEGRITKGLNATEGQFPFQVGLSMETYDNKYTWCGGSVIGKEWVLTAAHCIVQVQYAVVFFGTTELTVGEFSYTIYNKDFISHAGYNPSTFENDIALIKTPPITLGNKIQIIPLPSLATSYNSYVGEYAVASGWGTTNDSSIYASEYLQWTRLQIIENDVCKITFNFLVPSSICVATPGGKSTCRGDSGGPLVEESTGILIGVTSFGHIYYCERGYPTAFTRITSHLKWIKANTGIYY